MLTRMFLIVFIMATVSLSCNLYVKVLVFISLIEFFNTILTLRCFLTAATVAQCLADTTQVVSESSLGKVSISVRHG